MNSKSIFRHVGFVILIALAVTACGPKATPAATPVFEERTPSVGMLPQAATAAVVEPPSPLGAAPADKSSAGVGAPEAAGSGAGSASASSAFVAPAPTLAAGAAPAGEAASSAGGVASVGPAVVVPPASSGSGPVVQPPLPGGYVPPDQQFQAALTAGEVDDNKDFAAYLQYRLDYHKFSGAPVHDVDITERHAIRVRTAGGLPVLGAQVTVYDSQQLIASIRTTATGIAYFFPNAAEPGGQAQSFTVVVQKDQASKTFTLNRQNRDDVWDVTLPVDPEQAPVKLDVLFLLDSTGSMGDEIQQLKDNLMSISAQINALPSQPDVRFGLVTYRDRGDVYVVRSSDFTSNVQEFQQVLAGVQAAGGGDNPESLNEAMHVAISSQDIHWRVQDTVSLVFLVSDAPPHLDYPNDYDYAQEMINAAAMGIKINPIAASGLNDQGEYIFRQIGQYTGGRFIFLTYKDTPQSNGQPGTTHHVQEGSYTVEDLDTLVVKMVRDELAQLSAQQGQQ